MRGRVFITRYDRHLAPDDAPHWEVLWEDPVDGPLEVQDRVLSLSEALAWAGARSEQIIVTLPFDGGQYWAGRGAPEPPGPPLWDWSRFRDE